LVEDDRRGRKERNQTSGWNRKNLGRPPVGFVHSATGGKRRKRRVWNAAKSPLAATVLCCLSLPVWAAAAAQAQIDNPIIHGVVCSGSFWLREDAGGGRQSEPSLSERAAPCFGANRPWPGPHRWQELHQSCV